MPSSERIWRGRRSWIVLLACAALVAACKPSDRAADAAASANVPPEGSCPSGNGGITLPPGFCATVYADSVGHARDIVVAPNGDVFVNTWSGQYYDKQSPPGAFLIGLRDTKHAPAGPTPSSASGNPRPPAGRGETGIALHGGYVYAEAGSQIVRYQLPAGQLRPDTTAEAIVTNLPLTGDHPMHPFVIDSLGSIYMDVGSASNSCQIKNRTLQSPGRQPCVELNTRAGIWKFDANKAAQRFSPAQRFATGLRNAVGFAIEPSTGQVFATQHGRDQLGENWPKLYTLAQSAELPAEEVVHRHGGCGLRMAGVLFRRKPEETRPGAGVRRRRRHDGRRLRARRSLRSLAFPGALGARRPRVLFRAVRSRAGTRAARSSRFTGPGTVGRLRRKATTWCSFRSRRASHRVRTRVFANGFAGAVVQPDKATHRPVGLAVAPDGALYIADDQGGRIWRVTYQGTARGAQPAAAP